MADEQTTAPHPDAVQHGGDHYKEGGALQHWNMLALIGFGWEYYVGAATKYTTRYMKKKGAEDVTKAMHFTEKLISLIEEGTVPMVFRTTQGFRYNLDKNPAVYDKQLNVEQLVYEYCLANKVTNKNAIAALLVLFQAGNVEDLHDALGYLVALHKDVTGFVEPVVVEPTAAERAATATEAGVQAIGAADRNYVAQGGPDERSEDPPAVVTSAPTPAPKATRARPVTRKDKGG